MKYFTRPIYTYLSFFFNDTATTEIYTLSLHDALPILTRPASSRWASAATRPARRRCARSSGCAPAWAASRSWWRSRDDGGGGGSHRNATDAAVPRHQGPLSPNQPVFPDGRLLRNVRGRRQARRS